MKIGIAGAGLVGRLMALVLVEQGAAVHLFDQTSGVENSCAFAAAGMLAPVCESTVISHSLMQLGLDSLPLWSSIQERLKKEFLESNGTLVVAHSQNYCELDQFASSIKSLESIKRLDKEGLREIEPALDRFKQSIFVRNEGHVNSRVFLDLAINYVLEHGACFHQTQTIEKVDSGLIKTDEGTFNFDFVIDSRGLGAKNDLAQLRGVRGEIVTVQTREINLRRPVRLLHPRHPIYIVPRPFNHFLVGATTLESEDSNFVSVQSAVDLLNALYSVHEAFAEARIIEMNARNRPAFLHNEPQIIVKDRLIQINGLYRHGFMVAPKIVLEVGKFLSTSKFDQKFEKLFVKESSYASVN